MPLILAIEPDRRQASRVAGLTREALDAELLIAETTERGVTVLNGRVPDLILTSLLLSPRDEAALREFHQSGEPVPTLMIPVLASSSRRHAEGRLRGRLPWSKAPAPVAAGDGCDPKVFAAQIEEYLTGIREEREDAKLRLQDDLELHDNLAADSDVPEDLAFDSVDALALVSEAPGNEIHEEGAQDTCEDLAAAGETAAAGEAGAFPEEAGAAWEEIVIEEHADEDDRPIELSGEAIDLQAFVEELKATYTDLFPVFAEPTPRLAESSSEPLAEIASRSLTALSHELPFRAAWPSLEGVPADETPLVDITEIVAEFVAALDDTADEPDGSEHAEADSDLWMPLGAAPGVFWPRLESACSGRRPTQDEWGFFDPDQCGFSALVAKLDQMTR